ncbi:hypothetical protein P3X46_012277, partial [Hevea brasiliensis]
MSALRHHTPPGPPRSNRAQEPEEESYNIIPIHKLLADQPSLRYPKVRAAAATLRTIGNLRKPPYAQWHPSMDLLDWLALFFGLQKDNVRNQQEHIVFHLANAQMLLTLPPDNIDTLDATVLRRFRRKLLKNYTNWCSYLNKKSNIWIPNQSSADLRRELLYASLNLFIGGEAANLRFMPECICYIFHNKAMELKKILEDYIDKNTGQPMVPSFLSDNVFLNCVVKPIYETINEEVERLKLFLQFSIIIAWEDKKYPWEALADRSSLLDAGMQYSLVSRETMWLGVRMFLKSAIAAGWIIVFGVFYGRIWSQKNSDGRWSDEARRRIVNFLEVALVFVLPELLALALFIIPRIRNFLENSNWRIFYLLSWWFQSRSFVGRGLREWLFDNIKYTLFWVLVLATKFSFSYFLQIKPMIKPSRQLVDLKNVTYEWHEFFKNSNRFAVGLLWLPMVLIYLMDLQIWYSIYSSFVGAAVGLFAHLGEIRNIQQLKLRFQFFGSAIQFNLMPEEKLLNARGTLKIKFKDAIYRLKLRYGLGRPYTKLEEEDIISDQELELLELPQNSWNVRVIRWPCFLLCNELLLALSQAKDLMCKNEHRRCVIIEAYDSVKHLLLEIIKINTEEHSIITIEKFTKTFNMIAFPHFHTKLIKLVELLNKPKKDLNRVVNTLQALYEIAMRDFFKEKRSTEQLREDGLATRDPTAMVWLLFQNAIELPDA